ncbi:hypothetical protein VTK26DRAFT_155 [Humicola hyalothermophila]
MQGKLTVPSQGDRFHASRAAPHTRVTLNSQQLQRRAVLQRAFRDAAVCPLGLQRHGNIGNGSGRGSSACVSRTNTGPPWHALERATTGCVEVSCSPSRELHSNEGTRAKGRGSGGRTPCFGRVVEEVRCPVRCWPQDKTERSVRDCTGRITNPTFSGKLDFGPPPGEPAHHGQSLRCLTVASATTIRIFVRGEI